MISENYANRAILKRRSQVKGLGLYSFFRPITETNGRLVVTNGKKQVMIGSNNYLGLTHHPYVIEKTKKAIEKYGTGCTGSRFLNGNLDIHEELEVRLAKFMGQENAIVFSTGMQTNLGAITALAGDGETAIYSDGENHASIIDACRLSRAPLYVYKHNNMFDLEEKLLATRQNHKNALIIADGVFSMTGAVVNLPEMVKLSSRYNCQVYIDDAHGLGVMGPRGEGTPVHFGLEKMVDFTMGTFSKSFASIGGVLAGPKDAIEFVRMSARAFMFSAAIPPSAAATVLACLDLVENDSSYVERLRKNVDFMNKGFKDLGLFTFGSNTPIIPILVGDDLTALQVAKAMEEMGVFATSVVAPAVPKGDALIRTSYMAAHETKDLEYVLEVFKKLMKIFPFPTKHG